MTEDKRLNRIKKLFDHLSQETNELADKADKLEQQLLVKETKVARQSKEIKKLREKVRGFEEVGRELLEGMRKLETAITEPEDMNVPNEATLEKDAEKAEEQDNNFSETVVGAESSEDPEKDTIDIGEARKEKKAGSKRKRRLYEVMFGE